MKSKVVIALLIAVVMLGTLAMPALATAPVKGTLLSTYPFTGTGTITLKMNHNNHIDVDIDLRGASSGHYYLLLSRPSEEIEVAGYFQTDAKGRIKFATTTVTQFVSGTTEIIIPLIMENASRLTAFYSPDTFTFTVK
jgi:hypothetical protein